MTGMAASLALAIAAAPACCRIFGIDIAPILGDDAAVCGRILDADGHPESEAVSAAERERAARCALDAQAAGRAFVYTYRQLLSPDVDLVVQAVHGTRGERLLMKMGLLGRENIHSVEVCAEVVVLPEGRIRSAGCTVRHPLIERLRAIP